MKIGILSYPLNNNYGCYLQSFALLYFLKSKGYDVEYIFRRHDKPSWRFYIKFALKSLLDIICFRFHYPFYRYEWEYMLKNGKEIISFFDKYITPHTKAIYTTKKLRQQCRNYDLIVVGSDQVWRAEILSNVEDYFLPFVDGLSTRKIGYAVSFGKENPGYTDSQIVKCGEAVKSFSAVSVREDVGIAVIERYGWKCKHLQVVLDPTMLLPSSSYISLLRKTEKNGGVLGYILDQTAEKSEILNYIARKYRVRAYNFLYSIKLEGLDYPPVERWLESIYYSKFVLTDSFHGAVFSIIFNKPFVVIVNEARGSARFETLLETFKLKDRILSKGRSIDELLRSSIDWESVNLILDERRKDSSGFLIKNIAK